MSSYFFKDEEPEKTVPIKSPDLKPPLVSKEGITIRQLKDFINDLPDNDKYGEDYYVWFSDTPDGLSNPVREIWRLNADGHGSDITLKQ